MPDDCCSFLSVGGVPVVTAPTEIDATAAGQLRGTLAAWADRGHTTVVVDMTGTQFCDSAGLTVLVRAHKQALAAGGALRLVLPVSGSVPRIFAVTGLDQVIPYYTGSGAGAAPGAGGEGPAAGAPALPRDAQPAGRADQGQTGESSAYGR